VIDNHALCAFSGGIESRTFEDVVITDFEVLDTGARIAETYNCVRTLLNKVFMDGFEG